eukprot:TRINITY_DN29116_c0_g1_i2.p1 TRINITY_DN29116_c0_g1~~TRINITY_DN29116_c0_g1_i2.p1  ORF type:complete len:560 (-),score=98.27 TRINITY_DN29116_c0_g1_i2:80-1726(-)
MLPTLIVFDLDKCLWSNEIDKLDASPSAYDQSVDGVWAGSDVVRLFPGARNVMQALLADEHLQTLRLAVVAAVEFSEHAHACLDMLLLDYEGCENLGRLVPHRQIYPGPKVAVDIASSCPGILCVRTADGISESDLDFGLAAFAEGKKGVHRDVFPRKAASPFREMLASRGCKSESIQNLGAGPGIYTCSWRCVGSCSCDKLYSNDNISGSSRWGCVHRWRTAPLPDGGHVHSFTSVHAPSFKSPPAFPAPPLRPESPGPPSNDFLRKFFDEDEAWLQFRIEEDKLKTKAEEQSEVDQILQEDLAKDDIGKALRESIAALDSCSETGGFAVIANEGSFVVGRCCEGKGSHTLSLKKLVEMVTGSGYGREVFEDFVALEKTNYIGQDLSRLVRAFIKITPVPDNPELEAKFEEIDALAAEVWVRDHAHRKNILQDQLVQKRAEQSEEAMEEWLASRIHTPIWQDFLKKAEDWVARCESLHEQWDQFESARSQWKAEVGDDRRFADRSFPSAPTTRWATDSMLQHAAKVVPHLATRWEQVLSRSSISCSV